MVVYSFRIWEDNILLQSWEGYMEFLFFYEDVYVVYGWWGGRDIFLSGVVSY